MVVGNIGVAGVVAPYMVWAPGGIVPGGVGTKGAEAGALGRCEGGRDMAQGPGLAGRDWDWNVTSPEKALEAGEIGTWAMEP
mmetsp:Transcript_48376/g.124892  ORF Transcript_48376/g.124892 Transcript_48376/m.124892 type:complete len:82 (-) Transcript_48376:776-1021(-)